jgi:hypothetical protein
MERMRNRQKSCVKRSGIWLRIYLKLVQNLWKCRVEMVECFDVRKAAAIVRGRFGVVVRSANARVGRVEQCRNALRS